jgi:hypothetical protein
MEVLMRKFTLLFAGSLALLAITISACKSTPPATESAPAAPVASPSANVVAPVAETKPVDDALTALRDRTEALRTEGLKYGLNTYKKDAWADAETSRNAGMDAYGKNYDLAKSSFEDAIAKYEKIRKDSFAELTPELDAAISKARESAIAAGCNSYYPEQFALADKQVSRVSELRDSGDVAGAYDAGQIALMRYQILIRAKEAVALRQKIEENNFSQYDQESFDIAEAKYAESASNYGTADPASLEAITESVARYKKVNNAGFKALSEPVIAKTDEIRTLCDSIKAKKSVSEPYAAASALYTGAASSAAAEDWESAYKGYSDASVAFSQVYEAASLKKNAADAAIAAAKAKQAASTDLAAKADQAAPLPENAEGYSADPYVIEGTGTPAAEPVAPAEPEKSSDSPAATESSANGDSAALAPQSADRTESPAVPESGSEPVNAGTEEEAK